MIRLNNDFLGFEPNRVKEWSGMDTAEAFAKNRLMQPPDWYYRNKKIEYSYNSNGHRCKEIADIDMSNYILFAGCSHTEGVGLELEKTYPCLISNKLGCDYYNLAIGGTGVDIVAHNIVTWVSKVKKQPKAICIQLPEITRIVLKQVTNSIPSFYPAGAWDKKPSTRMFLASGEEIGFFNARVALFRNLMKTVAKCPLYEYTSSPVTKTDWARDRGHAGIDSNIEYANNILTDLIPLF